MRDVEAFDYRNIGVQTAKSRARFNSDNIVDSLVKPLLTTEIFFRDLRGYVPQLKLDLF